MDPWMMMERVCQDLDLVKLVDLGVYGIYLMFRILQLIS